jgi:hypothetical protein
MLKQILIRYIMLKNGIKKQVIRFSLLLCSAVSFMSLTTDETISTLHFEDDLCKLETSIIRCNDIQNGTDVNYVMLKITNKTEKSIVFSCSKQVNFSNKPNSTSDGGNTLTFELAPNQILEGSCDKTTNSKLRIFSHMQSLKDVAILTSFSFSTFKTSYNN